MVVKESTNYHRLLSHWEQMEQTLLQLECPLPWLLCQPCLLYHTSPFEFPITKQVLISKASDGSLIWRLQRKFIKARHASKYYKAPTSTIWKACKTYNNRTNSSQYVHTKCFEWIGQIAANLWSKVICMISNTLSIITMIQNLSFKGISTNRKKNWCFQ